MDKKYLRLNDIDAYKRAYTLSNLVWDIVTGWNYFARDTVGTQFTRSIDSISANIAEGFGRYTKKDKIKFYRIGKGSLKESLDWNEKSKARGLISEENHDVIIKELKEIELEINQLIKFTNERLKI